jgi:agmatinase
MSHEIPAMERFLACDAQEPVPNTPVILGCPLDVTATFRSGSEGAPAAIRAASDSIETYSPLLDGDLEDLRCADLGDVRLGGIPLAAALDRIETGVTAILERSAIPVCLGGEHTITLPIVRALRRFSDDFVVLHLDAHSDLRDTYEGSPINHATVMRRITEMIGPERLVQLGIRAGTREEFAWMRTHRTCMEWSPGKERALRERIDERPVYVSLDLDVLDPAYFPGTGNPEAGGWGYQDVERLLLTLERVNLIGADVVELNPRLDSSQVSSITAAKIVRELLLIAARTPRR